MTSSIHSKKLLLWSRRFYVLYFGKYAKNNNKSLTIHESRLDSRFRPMKTTDIFFRKWNKNSSLYVIQQICSEFCRHQLVLLGIETQLESQFITFSTSLFRLHSLSHSNGLCPIITSCRSKNTHCLFYSNYYQSNLAQKWWTEPLVPAKSDRSIKFYLYFSIEEK